MQCRRRDSVLYLAIPTLLVLPFEGRNVPLFSEEWAGCSPLVFHCLFGCDSKHPPKAAGSHLWREGAVDGGVLCAIDQRWLIKSTKRSSSWKEQFDILGIILNSLSCWELDEKIYHFWVCALNIKTMDGRGHFIGFPIMETLIYMLRHVCFMKCLKCRQLDFSPSWFSLSRPIKRRWVAFYLST